MLLPEMTRVALTGIGATLLLDLWFVLLRKLGVPNLSFAFLGRWAAHALRGEFLQPSIAKAPRVRGELALGYFVHYAIGVVFAGVLFTVVGWPWFQNPSLLPAVIVGACTVVAPLCVMQPAMGAGFAASKTPAPLKNCLRSVLNHTVFGVGLYATALIIASWSR
jgi:hypothetical protein